MTGDGESSSHFQQLLLLRHAGEGDQSRAEAGAHISWHTFATRMLCSPTDCDRAHGHTAIHCESALMHTMAVLIPITSGTGEQAVAAVHCPSLIRPAVSGSNADRVHAQVRDCGTRRVTECRTRK